MFFRRTLLGSATALTALSGPDGPASIYPDMMHHNATTLTQALGS